MSEGFEPGDELCPPWWPQQLWDFEWWHHPGLPGHGPGPVNRPPDVDDILVALHINVLSYRLADQAAAAEIRKATVGTITQTASKLVGHAERVE